VLGPFIEAWISASKGAPLLSESSSLDLPASFAFLFFQALCLLVL